MTKSHNRKIFECSKCGRTKESKTKEDLPNLWTKKQFENGICKILCRDCSKNKKTTELENSEAEDEK